MRTMVHLFPVLGAYTIRKRHPAHEVIPALETACVIGLRLLVRPQSSDSDSLYGSTGSENLSLSVNLNYWDRTSILRHHGIGKPVRAVLDRYGEYGRMLTRLLVPPEQLRPALDVIAAGGSHARSICSRCGRAVAVSDQPGV